MPRRGKYDQDVRVKAVRMVREYAPDRARMFIDPTAGDVLFRAYAQTWLSRHLGAGSTVAAYRSVLRNFYAAADVSFPTAVTVFPEEYVQAPRSWTENA